MKLITLYGAPGVGKLTTARALAELTGYRLFHNHLTFDLVKSLFEFPSPSFGKLAEQIRLSAFAAAADAGLHGVIFTMVYRAGRRPFPAQNDRGRRGTEWQGPVRAPSVRHGNARAARARARARTLRQDRRSQMVARGDGALEFVVPSPHARA